MATKSGCGVPKTRWPESWTPKKGNKFEWILAEVQRLRAAATKPAEQTQWHKLR